MVDIPEDERKNYPNPNVPGKFYERKIDTDNPRIYDDFILGMSYANELMKKISEPKSQKINLPPFFVKFFANKISIGSFVLGRNGLCSLDSFDFFFFLEKMLQKLTLYVSTFLSFYASS